MTQEPKLNQTEEVQPESEVLDFNKPQFKFRASNCDWVQRGYNLVCRSCELEHGVFIGPDLIMTGRNEKGPILKNRKDIGMV
jgi:hypothetical protein